MFTNSEMPSICYNDNEPSASFVASQHDNGFMK